VQTALAVAGIARAASKLPVTLPHLVQLALRYRF
jgi:hypothetical protein